MKKVGTILLIVVALVILAIFVYNIGSFFFLLCSGEKTSTIMPLLRQRLFILFLFSLASSILGWAGKACILFLANKSRKEKKK